MSLSSTLQGEHRLDDELQAELERIHKVANATERFLVIDAQVGQAAGPVAAGFHDLVGVSGVIVSKLMVLPEVVEHFLLLQPLGLRLSLSEKVRKSLTLRNLSPTDLSLDYLEWETSVD